MRVVWVLVSLLLLFSASFLAGVVISVALTQHKDLHIGSAQQTLVEVTMTVVREFSGKTLLTMNPFSVEIGSSVRSVLGWGDKDMELTALRVPV